MVDRESQEDLAAGLSLLATVVSFVLDVEAEVEDIGAVGGVVEPDFDEPLRRPYPTPSAANTA